MRCSKAALIDALEKNKDKLVIVEGRKDKAALEGFGFRKITTLKKSIFETCEDISKKADTVIILTDLDREGKKLYSMVYEDLKKNHVQVDNKFREFLFKETELRQIEGLTTYFQKLED